MLNHGALPNLKQPELSTLSWFLRGGYLYKNAARGTCNKTWYLNQQTINNFF